MLLLQRKGIELALHTPERLSTSQYLLRYYCRLTLKGHACHWNTGNISVTDLLELTSGRIEASRLTEMLPVSWQQIHN
jgi:hypothetical protein